MLACSLNSDQAGGEGLQHQSSVMDINGMPIFTYVHQCYITCSDYFNYIILTVSLNLAIALAVTLSKVGAVSQIPAVFAASRITVCI